MDKNEIILGAGEVYMYAFDVAKLPEDAEIETEEHNVGHCSGGFSVDYKPTKYDVINQYERIVKSFITKEEISAKTGVLTWKLKNLELLSTGKYSEDGEKKVRKLIFTGEGTALKTILLRFVHTKENGKKIRFTMIGQGGSGFALEFTSKELTVDAELSAIKVLDGFLASFDDVLTEDEMNAFQSRVEQLCNNAIETINSKKDESVSALAEMFSVDGFIDESEQAVLDYLTSNFDIQVEETNKLKQEIHDIQAAAVAEGRELNEEEIRNIEDKLMRIKQLELESLGATNEEVMYAKNEFAARVKTMELEEASQLLQEKAQLRDEEIVQITAAYDTQIDLLKQKLQEAEGEDARHLQRQIENLTKGKEDQIQLQKDLYDEYVDIVREGNEAAYNEVDEHTGKILSNADKEHREQLAIMKEKYSELNEITKSGNYLMYDTQANTYRNVTALVDESTGEVIGAWSIADGEIGASSENIADQVADMASDLQGSYQLVDAAALAFVDSSGVVIDALGNEAGALADVKVHTDGTREGILSLNGTPVEVKVNKDGTISSIEEISRSIDAIPTYKEIMVHVATSGVSDALSAVASIGAAGRRHFNGIDNVPYDGYQATLHKNERVLTAAENAAYSVPEKIDYNKMAAAMRNALRDMTFQVGDREFARLVRSVK